MVLLLIEFISQSGTMTRSNNNVLSYFCKEFLLFLKQREARTFSLILHLACHQESPATSGSYLQVHNDVADYQGASCLGSVSATTSY